MRHITAEHYFLQPVSNTFHGRDVFAPCAGWLSKGVEAEKFGEEITDLRSLLLPKPKMIAEHTLKGAVLKVDKFGNLITNLTPENAPARVCGRGEGQDHGGRRRRFPDIRNAYAEGQAGETFGLLNSMGFLEIACNRGAASQLAKAGRGAEVVVEF